MKLPRNDVPCVFTYYFFRFASICTLSRVDSVPSFGCALSMQKLKFLRNPTHFLFSFRNEFQAKNIISNLYFDLFSILLIEKNSRRKTPSYLL